MRAVWLRKGCALLVGAVLVIKGWPILGLLLASAAVNGWTMDRIANRKRDFHGEPAGEDACALHEAAFVADLHADICLWGRDLMRHNERGHVDLPRLRAGNVGLQFVTVPTKLVLTKRAPSLFLADLFSWGAFAQLQRPDRWFSSAPRAKWQLENCERWIEQAAGELVLVTDRAALEDVRRRRDAGESTIGIMLGLEGAHALRGDLDVSWLAEKGFRVLGITHFNDTRFGDSAHGWRKRGLTAAGRELVKELDDHGITIDLAHASETVIADCLAMANAGELTRPFLVTHTGVKGVHDHRRNISDEQALAIARGGGLVGVSFFEPALARLEVSAVAETVVYLIELFDSAGLRGAEHVALGSDFDGAVRTVIDAAGWPRVTQALLSAGLDAEQVRGVIGGNVARFFARWLP